MVKKASGTEGFVKRLNQACDDLPHIIPPFGEGRQIELAKRMGMSQQGVRKWFSGEAMPRREAMQRLARLLEVEEPWLALGIMPEVTRAEKKINARNLDGAVMLVMGMLTLAGGTCALPGEKDSRRDYVDFYVILRGTQMAIHIAVAQLVSPGVYQLRLPREYAEVRTIVVIPVSDMRYDFIDLDNINAPTHMQRKAGGYSMQMSRIEGKYVTGDTTWKTMKHFKELA